MSCYRLRLFHYCSFNRNMQVNESLAVAGIVVFSESTIIFKDERSQEFLASSRISVRLFQIICAVPSVHK